MTGRISLIAVFWLPALAFAQPVASPPFPMATKSDENLVHIDATKLTVQRVDYRWQLWADRRLVKDFGGAERDATEAARLLKDLNVTQFGTIPGSQPVFEYWLCEGVAPKRCFAARTMIPFNASKLKVEQVAGVWCVRDDKQVIYNFGTDVTHARQAFDVCKKYGFNQIGMVGNPPVMTYLFQDDYDNLGKSQEKSEPKPTAMALVNAVNEQGLIVPTVGYVGLRNKLEWRKFEVSRVQNEWCVVHGNETLARFDLNETQARDAVRELQDKKITEVCRVGTSSTTIYLTNGRLPTGMPLGANNTTFRPESLKVQLIGKVWCLCDGMRIVFEVGETREDAELLAKVLRQMRAIGYWEIGHPQKGGLRVLCRE